MVRTLSVALGLLAACSSSDSKSPKGATLASDSQLAADSGPASDAPAAGATIATDAQVCDALTQDEVDGELREKTTARMLPKAGAYGAPSCGWLVGDDPDGRGVTVTMFFQDNQADAKAYFAKKLDSVCEGRKLDVAGLGDEAALCGRLWVRKGTTYFSVSVQAFTGTPEEWSQMSRRLAAHILPRLP